MQEDFFQLSITDDEIHTRQKELEEIFVDIDRLQDEHDSLEREFAETQITIEKLKRAANAELSLKRRKRVERFGKKNVVFSQINFDLLSEEHKEFLKAKHDDIVQLRSKINEIRDQFRNIENENDLVTEENLTLQKSLSDITRNKINNENALKLVKEEIKNVEISKHSHEMHFLKLKSSLEESQRELQKAIDEEYNMSRNNDFSVYKNDIMVLEEEISNLVHIQTDLNRNIDECLQIDDEDKKVDQINAIDKNIGWREHKADLTNELSKLKEYQKDLHQKTDTSVKQFKLLMKRLKLLKPIHEKWSSEKYFSDNGGPLYMKIDDLLDSLSEKKAWIMNTHKGYENDLSMQKQKNLQLEKKRQRLTSEISQNLAFFKEDCLQKKADIILYHTNSSIIEKELLNRIKELSLKYAS